MISEMLHQYRLIEGLRIHEREGSFELDVCNNRQHLWMLGHLEHLEIAHHEIEYQIIRGFRQHKQTINPIRRMRKHFKNIFELFNYLDNKRYDIHRFKLRLTNGWIIDELPYIALIFHTNNLIERNALLSQFFQLAGIPASAIDTLETASSYAVKMNENGQYLEKYELDDEKPAKIIYMEDYGPFCSTAPINFEPDIDFPF
jgi:uncharacterized phage-like protein YoqJ